MHQIDHPGRGAALGDLVQDRSGDAQPLPHTPVLGGNRQSEKTLSRQGGDRLLGKGPLGVDPHRMRSDLLLGNRARTINDGRLRGVQSIHGDFSPLFLDSV